MKHNKRAARKMRLANLEGQELSEWLDLAAKTLAEGTEGNFTLLRRLRTIIGVVAVDTAGLDREIEAWTAEVQKSIDDLSVLGPDGRPVPFGLINDPLEMDAALEHSLVMQESIVTNMNERLGDIEDVLSKCAGDEEVARTLREVSEVRARLSKLAPMLRTAIEV